jgi:hypothetical protein
VFTTWVPRCSPLGQDERPESNRFPVNRGILAGFDRLINRAFVYFCSATPRLRSGMEAGRLLLPPAANAGHCVVLPPEPEEASPDESGCGRRDDVARVSRSRRSRGARPRRCRLVVGHDWLIVGRQRGVRPAIAWKRP